MRRVAIVVRKELAEILANRGLVASMCVMPTLIVLAAIGVVGTYSLVNDPSYAAMADELRGQGFPGTPQQVLIAATCRYALGLLLMVPTFLPVPIAALSVAGEKERRTLEPLLASPVSALELLVGKSLAAVLPVVTISLLAFLAFGLGVDLLARPHFAAPLVPDRLFLFTALVLAPLFSLFGTTLTVLISARVGEARLAQTVSGLLVTPVIGVTATQFIGLLSTGRAGYLALAVFAVVADVALIALSARLFDREALLTRWG